jgi:hypothetical protein
LPDDACGTHRHPWRDGVLQDHDVIAGDQFDPTFCAFVKPYTSVYYTVFIVSCKRIRVNQRNVFR